MKHYRHRITVEARTDTPDDYGGESGAWAEVCTIWAKVTPNNGGEQFASGEVAEVGTLTVETWYRTDINAKCRILYGDRVLQIESVTNDEEQNRKLIISCKEVR